MKIQFVGCGSAFTTSDYYQSNMVITSDSGKKLLIDCGSDIRFSLGEQKIAPKDIDAVYISHCHADHCGGMEWLAFCTYFAKLPKPKLYCETKLMDELWNESLKGGLESLQGQLANLTTYFDCHAVAINDFFVWEDTKFTPIQTVHIMSGMKIKYSYGLLVNKNYEAELKRQEKEKEERRGKHLGNGLYLKNAVYIAPEEPHYDIFITTDVQFCPHQILDFYKASDIIFQDCETAFKSGVHAHYSDLKTLPEDIKNKMWLYHYQPNPEQINWTNDKGIYLDGFSGFVKKGQVFEF